MLIYAQSLKPLFIKLLRLLKLGAVGLLKDIKILNSFTLSTFNSGPGEFPTFLKIIAPRKKKNKNKLRNESRCLRRGDH